MNVEDFPEQANGNWECLSWRLKGTVVLEEVAALTAESQEKLLRVLEAQKLGKAGRKRNDGGGSAADSDDECGHECGGERKAIPRRTFINDWIWRRSGWLRCGKERPIFCRWRTPAGHTACGIWKVPSTYRGKDEDALPGLCMAWQCSRTGERSRESFGTRKRRGTRAGGLPCGDPSCRKTRRKRKRKIAGTRRCGARSYPGNSRSYGISDR